MKTFAALSRCGALNVLVAAFCAMGLGIAIGEHDATSAAISAVLVTANLFAWFICVRAERKLVAACLALVEALR